MRASKVTQYGIPGPEGGRACELKIGEVRVFLTGESSEEISYVAESLRSYWNADDPDDETPRSDFAGVESVCRRIAGGAPMVCGDFSVGPWTPAVADGFDWAVLDKRGAAVLLAHDAFEAARHFCRLVEGSTDDAGGPYRLATDAQLAQQAQTERNWF